MRTRRAREQHGRRHVATRGLGAGIIALAMLASACSSGTTSQDEPSESADTGDPSEAASPAAATGDLLRVGLSQPLPTLLVPGGAAGSAEQTVVEQVFEGLVKIDFEQTAVKPMLATSWEISDDGLTYTFELREDVVFQDGTPFDSEAVQLNYERITDPDSPYYWEVGAGVAGGRIYGNVASLEVTGPHSVVFHLKQPDPDWMLALCETLGRFVSPAVIKDNDPDEVSQSPIGTGPFQLERRDASALTFTRNPTYWGPEPPLPGFVFRGYPDAASRFAALEAGDIDYNVSASPDIVAASDPDQFKPVSFAAAVPWFFRLNHEHEALGDVRVRQALNYAIDREALVEGLFQGLATPMARPLPPGNIGYDPDAEDDGYEYDPERAQELLAEAGYADGLSIKALIPTSGLQQVEPMTQAIQADLLAVGVDVQYDTLEWTSYLEQVGPGLTDEYAMAPTEWWDLKLTWLRQQLGTDGFPDAGANIGYYSNPDADQLMDEADAVGVEPQERLRLYHEAQSLMFEDAPWLMVLNRPVNGLSTHAVDGIGTALAGPDLSTATLDSAS